MVLEDKEKMPFIMDQGPYYYKVMHFGLKNIGVIYQCLVNKISKDQINRNIKVYINNMKVAKWCSMWQTPRKPSKS